MTQTEEKNIIGLFVGLLVLGAVLAYVDHQLHLDTLLVETVHALVVTGILVFCIVCQKRNPEIKRYGWTAIIIGLVLMTIGAWVDLFDDPIAINWITIHGVPFGRSWEQAFIKKILGYTGGIFLIAYGLSRWIPWMIQSRLDTQRLNQRLSTANQDIHRMLMSRDEHVEAERLNIARELHDDVAQELTFLNVQLQLCQKEISQTPQEAQARLTAMRNEVSEILKHVRQLSRDLRPEPLYALGFLAALDQFLEKLRAQQPDINLVLKTELLPDAAHRSVESLLGDRDQLHLFRVVQEGIRNALKHSQAKTVEITVKESRDGYAIVIDDDGVGLPWTMMPNDAELVQQGHLGVVGMKERITELKGQLTLQARAQQRGSRLKIEVPLS